MDFQKAIKSLEIDLNKINKSELTADYIKKRFHKLALLNHPDKKGNTKRFQEINEAYSFLLKELDIINDESNTFPFAFSPSSTFESDFNPSNMYIHLLTTFIEGIINTSFCRESTNESNSTNYKSLIIDIIKKIILSEASLEKIFENLDKSTSQEIYNFIFKYKHILHIDSKLVEKIGEIIKNMELKSEDKTNTKKDSNEYEEYKYEEYEYEEAKNNNPRIFFLKPTLTDLLENNLYKLFVDNQLYLVPLWHSELYFDTHNSDIDAEKETTDKNDIIVICNPELPENITIDEDNNVHILHFISFDSIKELLINNIETFDVSLGNRIYKCSLNYLNIKKEQHCTFKKQGISQIIENDMYNISYKSDVIINIVIEV
jgi:curved DNA-binding protein CbpA